MEAITITTAEIIDALKAAGTAPKAAKTVAQLCFETCRGQESVRKSLRILHAAGRLVRHQVESTDIAGRRCTIPAYTIRPARQR